jgi:hypothetical protein
MIITSQSPYHYLAAMSSGTSIVNKSITSAQTAWYAFKFSATASTLPLQNWVVTTSSTGAGGVYAAQGDVITSVASLGNLSWFVLQGKGVVDNGTLYRRQLCFQFNAAGAVRIKYSARAGFVTGSPSLTQVPTAADEAVFYGSGTDAAPVFAALFPSSGSWMQGVFSESTDALVALTYPVGGGLPTSLIYLDVTPLVYTIGGSLLDPDPCVIYAAAGSGSGVAASLASESTGPMGWLSYGTLDALWCRLAGGVRAVFDSTATLQVTIPGAMPFPPTPLLPTPTYAQESLLYGRRTALTGLAMPGDVGNLNTVGIKGPGQDLRWSGQTFAMAQPVNVAYLASGGVGVGCLLGDGSLMYPWPTGVAPQI